MEILLGVPYHHICLALGGAFLLSRGNFGELLHEEANTDESFRRDKSL